MKSVNIASIDDDLKLNNYVNTTFSKTRELKRVPKE